MVEPKYLESESFEPVMVTFPELGDLEKIVEAQRAAWRATYVSPENGVTSDWVETVVARFSAQYIAERYESYRADPNIFYRVVKDGNSSVIGFMHGERGENENIIHAIYVHPDAIGTGAGGALMRRFLAWAGNDRPITLEAASYNNRAIGFYEHYGFKVTRDLPKFLDVMPLLEMVRPANSEQQDLGE